MLLITGANGFLASWAIRILSNFPEKVVALVRPNSDCWRIRNIPGLQIIRKPSGEWHKVISTLEPRVVLTFDWDGVEMEKRNSTLIQHSNVARILDIANAAISPNLEIFISFGSQGEIDWSLKDPKNKKIQITEYGKAKIKLKESLQDLFSDQKIRFIWARVFSVYGPLDTRNSLINLLIQNNLQGVATDVSEGNETWSFLYVEDFARAIVKIIGVEKIRGEIDIGSTEAIKISRVFQIIEENLASRDLIKRGFRKDLNDADTVIVPFLSPLLSTGWYPTVTLENGLKNTIKWHRNRVESNFGNTVIPILIPKTR